MSEVAARAWRWPLAAVLVGAAVSFTQCHVSDALDARPWRCDPSAPDCGDLDGKPMTCWEGYCMPSCDYDHPPSAGSGTQCLFGDVLVHSCDPTPDQDLDADCGDGFHCYRTDLVFALGICVPFPVCSESSQCTDPRHNVCASDAIRELTGQAQSLATNGLVCLTDDCQTNPAICGDEVCLTHYYQNAALPDICVPRCDGAGQCLPNFACAHGDAVPGGDRICVPGFPGVRCEHEQDCAFGWCLPATADFSICSIPCQTDQSCEPLNSAPTYYRCIEGLGGKKLCASTAPFQGVRCDDERECTSEAPFCTNYHVYGPSNQAECRPRCGDDGRCPPRAGLAQACLADGSCYPGMFSVPCQDSSECLTPFSCLAVDPSAGDVVPAEKICTIACKGDLDCQPDPEHPQRLDRQNFGYCDGAFCRLPGFAGAACERAEQCRSGDCDSDTGLCR